MLRIVKAIFLVMIFIFVFPLNTSAQDLISINDMIENAKEYDGKHVTIQGEVIGECLERGEYSWININDGTNAIGIWLKNSDTKSIKYYGNYKYRGDIIKIKGIFNRACKEHGGEPDIHNISFEKIKSGFYIQENVSAAKIFVSIVFVISALLMFLFYYKVFRVEKGIK
ncbi:DNA-binding protein [Anaerosacchariphilus polymeriproducens]|uniref:DNA-binding protein n=1 Tax=Anaerosacchariphilus polymeriproducens TaxID=1812858 RepID=A0A371AYQ7_9FIRM|nr:DNA-binding protein [Anaerosacchariphilus polymeriproducens]RDU24734.1 DNA-binding protein [Anaerosacchariphilus polymeriproducens]